MNIDTTAIRDIAYPEVASKMVNPAAFSKYKRFMGDWMNRYQKQLYANIPNKMIFYTYDDINKWFAATGIDKKKILEGIKGTYFYKIAAFNPRYAKDESTIAILCLVRYYMLEKKQAELNLALLNLAFSGKFYPSIFYKAFKYDPAEHIMDYVVNHMLNNKFDIVKYGNVIGAVKSVTNTWFETYQDKLTSFTDDEIRLLVQQLHNRIDSFMQNIAKLFYEAYENKDSYITYDSDDVSEDNYHLADNDSFKINRIVENSMTELCTKSIDFVNCKRASNPMVKFEELKSILDSLLNNKDNLPLLKEFITLMVSLYFQQSKYKDVTDISFISFSIKPTPNTKNPYVIRKKELMDIILINNAENFKRRRSRLATESAYYRAFNAYIALMIKKANSKS